MKASRSVLLTIVLVAGITAASPASAAPTGAYVALGDSYTAGPLIPDQVFPFGCLRSDANYPNVVQEAWARPRSGTRAAAGRGPST